MENLPFIVRKPDPSLFEEVDKQLSNLSNLFNNARTTEDKRKYLKKIDELLDKRNQIAAEAIAKKD